MTPRRTALVLFTALLCLLGLSSAPAFAATTSTVKGVASGRCLDVEGNVQDPGTGMIIWDCNGGPNQAFELTATRELRVFGGTRCLDVTSASTAPGARVQIWTCHGGSNQQWLINANGTITSAQSGLCLEAAGGATGNRTVVQMGTCNGQTSQKWTSSFAGRDTTAPSVPANARVSNLVCDSVTFAWDASSDNVGVAYYDVYHDGQLMKSVSGSTTSTQLTVSPGVTWGLYVNARDAAGNVSQASKTVSITPPQCQADTQAPSAPSNLKATASGTTVTLSWTGSTDNIGVRAYDVYRGGAKVGSTTAPTVTFTDSGLAANTSYSYYVTARDAQGNTSSRSATATATTGAACSNAVCSVSTVATDTDIPWGLVTLPDGTVLYNRRDAHDIIALNPATGAKTNLGTVPNVESTDGEGGLMGLAISSGFASDRWLYLMHTSPTDNRIVRIKYTSGVLQPSTEQVLLTGIGRNKFHNGGRLRFGPDGKLYASTGDAQNGDNAQNVQNLAGKVLRINADGTIPSDNPFGNAVWSYGHRNPQGLAFDSQGRLWEQEFGNSVMDETNLITKGGNYGWPACEGTTGSCGTAGFIAPKRTYPTADGSCSGLTIVKDVLFVACGRGSRLYREVISGSSLTNVTQLFVGTYGRLRTVEPAPGGNLWLTTTNVGDKDSVANNSDEKIFRVVLGQPT